MTVRDFARHASVLAGRTALVGAVLSVTGLLISKPVALGMLLGVTAGCLRLKLSTKALLRFAAGGAARAPLVGQRLINFVFVGAALFVAFSTSHLNQWAALAGVLLPNAVTVVDTLGWAAGDGGETDRDEGGMGSRLTERT